MVSCGRDNVRVWRVRNGSLRSAPVNLGQTSIAEFTDVCFEAPSTPGLEPADKLVWVNNDVKVIQHSQYRENVCNISMQMEKPELKELRTMVDLHEKQEF